MENPEMADLYAEYGRVLARQHFDSSDSEGGNIEKYRAFLDMMDTIGSSSVSVFDLKKKEHTYISRHFELTLGYDPAEMAAGGNDFFDSRMHPEDLKAAFRSAIHFFKLMVELSADKRADYKLLHEYRLRNGKNNYVRVIEQFQSLEQDALGNVRLGLCVADLSPDQDLSAEFRSRLINIKTGESYLFRPEEIPGPASGNDLSRREKEILGMVSRGLLSKEIADQLCVSVHTVNTHRQRIIRKLNVNNTTEAVRFAGDLGLLS